MAIAGSVQKGGKYVTTQQIERAKAIGATDKEIHDTVLIAAAFCMFNRYVDGLDTWMPDDPEMFRKRAALVSEFGYTTANPTPVNNEVAISQPA